MKGWPLLNASTAVLLVAHVLDAGVNGTAYCDSAAGVY